MRRRFCPPTPATIVAGMSGDRPRGLVLTAVLPGRAAVLVAAMLGATAFAAPQGLSDLDRAAALVEEGRLDEARPLLVTLAKQHPADGTVAYWLGRVHFGAEAYGDAIDWLEKAVTRDVKNTPYRLWLGRAYAREAQRANVFRQLSLAGKARTSFEQAVALDPDHVEARMDLFEYYRQAPGVAGGGRDKARQQVDEIFKRDPVQGHVARAALCEDDKDTAGAEREYKAAIELRPSIAGPYLGLGQLYVRLEEHDLAFEVYERGLKAKPNDLPLLYQVGRTSALSGRRLEEGARALVEYLARTPPHQKSSLAAAHWRLGMIREHQDAREAAREEYEKALRLDPKRKEAAEALRRLRR